jgi:hypothetical protein
MNDKLQQIYNLYVSKGLINVDFDTFASSNLVQQTEFYNLGVKNGLINAVSNEEFQSAFRGAPLQHVQQTQPQEIQRPQQPQQAQQIQEAPQEPEYDNLVTKRVEKEPANPRMQQFEEGIESILPGLK